MAGGSHGRGRKSGPVRSGRREGNYIAFIYRKYRPDFARYGAVFAQGLWNTLWLSFVSVFLGTFLGILVALGKLSRHKLLNGVVSTYIEIIRGTPILLQLYFFWLALPNILPSISDTTCILSALVVNASAYIAEVIRAGIQAVDAGQREASLSLGMTERAL